MRYVLSVCLFTALLTVDAANFAALTIIPSGSEQFDISTGLTTLPDGGEIIDAARKLQLRSDFIRYEEGKFIETEGATVEGPFGTLKAAALRLDLENNVITAQGELSLENRTLFVTAHTLTLFLDAEVARLEGEVSSAAPEFETRALVLQLDAPDALLIGPYWFQNGPFLLKQSSAESLLQLRREGQEGAYVYNPSSKVEASLLQHLGPYLP